MSNKLLFDTQPLVVIPELAVAIGLDEAIVLQQIHYWCHLNEKARSNYHYRDGYYWVYNSMPKWNEQFPWYKKSKLERTFASLKEKGLIIIANYNARAMDRTNWYRVDYDALQRIIDSRLPQNEVMNHRKLRSPIPETNTDIDNGKKEKGNFPPDRPADIPVENPLSVSIPIVEQPNEEISGFIDWYFARYMEYYGEPHPNIKSQQRIRVTETLAAFMDENCLDVECLQEMAYAFFDNVEYTDHNINHFATYGILENRYYEAIY